MKNDTVVKFDVTVGGASDEAGRIDTVVAAHGVKEQQSIREAPSLHLAHTAPFDIAWVVILFVARHFAAAASDARRSIEVEAVLFPFIQRRDIDRIVPALHPRICFVADEAL